MALRPNAAGPAGSSLVAARFIKEFSMAAPCATGSRIVCQLVGLVALAVWCSPSHAADLFRDDFSGFPPGWLTRPIGQLNAAIQEYHYLPHRGVPLGPWANAICHLDAWAVGEEEGKSYLEQHTVNDQAAADEPDLPDRRPRVGGLHRRGRRAASVARRHGRGRLPLPHQPPLLPVRADGGQPGAPGAAAAARERHSAWRSGASSAAAPFPYDTTRYYRLRVENEGLEDPGLHRRQADPHGRRRRAAPGQGRRHRQHPGAVPGFPRDRVADEAKRGIDARIARREAELAELRGQNPRPKLWKTFKTPKFGAGGTSGSATSTATARPRCSSPRTSPGSATTSSRSVA